MITNSLYNYSSSDKDCILGLMPNNKEFASLISPLNESFIWPNSNMNEGEEQWIKKCGILTDYDKIVKSDNGFYCDTNPWSLKTPLSLNNINSNNLTFSTKININTDNIGNSIVTLFKQGTVDNNGLIDIYFNFKRDDDNEGNRDSLVIKVYYTGSNNLSYLNTQLFEISNINFILNRDVQLIIMIDTENSMIMAFEDGQLFGKKIMKFSSDIQNITLNIPYDRGDNDNLMIGSNSSRTDKLRVKNIFIWRRILTLNELLFFNRLIV